MKKVIYPRKIIRGIINLPGDKSISHRAIILGAIANGETKIKNFLFSKTCITTLNCLKDLGAEIKINAGDIMLYGNNCLVVFYKSFDTTYSYTKIGHIDNLPNLDKDKVIIKFESV